MRFNLPRLIGISGRAGSGKDTLADYLVRQFGYHKYSLAGPLKQLLADRFGFAVEKWEDRSFKDKPSVAFGMDGLCEAFSPRSWAQWLGTEVCRTIGSEDVWANMMEREWLELQSAHKPSEPRMVVPDVRFDNEAQRILSLGGVVIRVVRPEVEGVATHASERGISDELVNVQVVNDKDIITYLREAVYALEDCPRGS